MIKHIVFFKWNQNKEQNTQELKKQLIQLKDKIKEIKQFDVGVNFSVSPNAYDLSLVSAFESKEDLAAYIANEDHRKVVDFIIATDTQIKVIDYEY